jgi:hypothetical protein
LFRFSLPLIITRTLPSSCSCPRPHLPHSPPLTRSPHSPLLDMSMQHKSHLTRSPSSAPIPPFPIMKDISSSKNVRTTLYPRKRPSPHGISKSRGQKDSPPPYPSLPNFCKSPRNVKAKQLARKQREAKVSALRRQGVYLEEEYREEIQRYMHEMEV